MQTIKSLLINSTTSLAELSDSAQLDCELILCSVLKKPRTYLHSWSDKMLSEKYVTHFTTLLNRRIKGEPIAHILGERGFWSLDLKVTVDTLIPRPDTERLVELALDIIPNNASYNILDLGTGTGAIARSIATEKANCFITATDKSLAALKVAQENAIKNEITNIEFIQSDWFDSLEKKSFDLIVSNPPYIKENDPHLQQGDVRFEPLSALTSGKDGLDDIRSIINKSKIFLAANAALLIEHGYDQANEVSELLLQAGFRDVENFTDIGNNPRVSVGYAL